MKNVILEKWKKWDEQASLNNEPKTKGLLHYK